MCRAEEEEEEEEEVEAQHSLLPPSSQHSGRGEKSAHLQTIVIYSGTISVNTQTQYRLQRD